MNVNRIELKIEGVVQGVGFRPFIYRLATNHHLGGKVWNDGTGVIIEVEGLHEHTRQFIHGIIQEMPALAKITHMQTRELSPVGYMDFSIVTSQGLAQGRVMVPPDVATCDKCRQELINPLDRHYQYPFTNCTNCGPRFTIVKGLPYDRDQTSMQSFAMCKACANEYQNPLDRRFHAQPVACPDCGPQVKLVDSQGKKISGNWLDLCGKFLSKGKIIAIKGLGGFHLACDATNKRVINKLRKLKKRPHKALAIMCRNLETVQNYCRVNQTEANLLSSPAAPIVVLQKKHDCSLPKELAPSQNSLGVMLPYTPLHILLFEHGLPVLVMTSGNWSDLPICTDNQEALDYLGEVADFFLIHNRPILNRCDDSVLGVVNDKAVFYRRSRGYIPEAIQVPVDAKAPLTVLGMGGDLKNTFCLLKGDQAFISQHIGDLSTLEGEQNFLDSLGKFKGLINANPEVLACDLHPQYNSVRLAKQFSGVTPVAVQHHHAHMASCMAENNLNEPVLGVILDGTGYGLDGCSWGFEIISGDYVNFNRELHLDYIPLPGGDNAVRHPWKTAIAYLLKYGGRSGNVLLNKIFKGKDRSVGVIIQLIERELNSPQAASCGRIFDMVAAILGICWNISYEGQAAVELSAMVPWLESAEEAKNLAKILSPYPFTIKNGIINPRLMIEGIIRDIERGASHRIAKCFHDTVIAMVVEAIQLVSQKTGLSKVVLSGGSWQNRYLSMLTTHILTDQGYQVYCHHKVPTNDGGLSLGQAMVGYWRCRGNVFGRTDAGVKGRSGEPNSSRE